MPIVQIVKAFLHLDERTGQRTKYEPGPHEMDEETANHWYVKANSDQAEKTGPSGAALDPRTATIEALRSAEVNLRAQNDARESATLVDNARQAALEAAEAKVAELQKQLDEMRQQDAAKTAEFLTQSHTAHSGASSQELLPNNPAHPESDEVLKARAEAERKGLSGPQMGKGETQDDDDKGDDDKPGNGRNTLRLPRASTKD